ncbi:MAG: hypothetical protein ABI675_24310 [Chitinophagaceae bacterium]
MPESEFFKDTLKYLSVVKYQAQFFDNVIGKDGKIVEEWYWRVENCNGNNTPEEFGRQFKALFESDYDLFTSSLNKKSSGAQQSILSDQIETLSRFKRENFISTLFNDIFNSRSTHQIKRFKCLEICGLDLSVIEGLDDDLLEPNYSLKLELLSKSEAFALQAEGIFEYYIRKLEYSLTFLQQANFSPKPSSQFISKQLSFEYKNLAKEPGNLLDFYHALKDEGFIEKSTTSFLFKNIFLGKEVKQPVVWTGTIGSLVFVVKTLKKQSKLNFEHNKLWETTIYCFTKPGGQRFTTDQLRKAKRPSDDSRLVKICNFL